MSDYYDELYFGGGKNETDGLVGCPCCGMSYAVAKCGHGDRKILVDPDTREAHVCNGAIQYATDDSDESTEELEDRKGEEDYVDYD